MDTAPLYTADTLSVRIDGVAAKVAVNRPAVMRSHMARPQTAKRTAAIIAAYHFRFGRKLRRVRALRHARAASRERLELGNPVNSLRADSRVPIVRRDRNLIRG